MLLYITKHFFLIQFSVVLLGVSRQGTNLQQGKFVSWCDSGWNVGETLIHCALL